MAINFSDEVLGFAFEGEPDEGRHRLGVDLLPERVGVARLADGPGGDLGEQRLADRLRHNLMSWKTLAAPGSRIQPKHGGHSGYSPFPETGRPFGQPVPRAPVLRRAKAKATPLNSTVNACRAQGVHKI